MEKSFLEYFCKYRDSEQTAVVCGETRLSYAGLYKCCVALARKLLSAGIGEQRTTPEAYDIFSPQQVAHSPWLVIITERSVNAVVGVIATWMAGGAYVLIGDDAPKEYVNSILKDTAANIVLDGDNFSYDTYDCESDFSYSFPAENEIACAIFTSGSTGRSKGAVLEHRSINAMLAWQMSHMDSCGWTATAAYAPFSFIASLTELFFPLASGLTLHILKDDVRRDILVLEDYIERHGISYLFLPPNVAEVFTETYQGGALKYLRIAGGRLKSCGTPVGYEIMYSLGMAENGGSVTLKLIRRAMRGTIPVGKPWGNTIVEIDKETGELMVSGPSLFRGYLNRRQETDKKLIDGSYHSGDVVSVTADGELMHMGRLDFSIKIRDMLVNPLQVENAISEVDGVVDCVVTSETFAGDTILVAWFSGTGSEQAIKGHIGQKLLPHMMPTVFRKLDVFPRNQNGKIDRDKLAPDLSSKAISGGNGKMSVLFSRVLGLPVADDDNLIALGGDSLKLMRLQLEIAREYKALVPMDVMLSHPTPASLEAVMDTQDTYAPIPKLPEQSGDKLSREYQPSPQMMQMWLLWRTGQDNGGYVLSLSSRYGRGIDEKKAIACFNEIVKSYAILRSRFDERKSGVVQVVEPETDVKLVDNPRRVMDLSKAPLFDICVHGDTLTFVAHHSLVDATSMRAIMEDFWTLYAGGQLNGELISVMDANAWKSVAPVDDEYWKTLFADGIPRLELPCDYQRPTGITKPAPKPAPKPASKPAPKPAPKPASESIVYDSLKVERLRKFASRSNATVFLLFLAAYALMLKKVADSKSVVIGVPFGGREHPDLERSVGMFVQTLPLKLDLGSMDIKEALAHTWQRYAEVSQRQSMSITRLTELLKPARARGRGAFYDVMVNYRPLPPQLDEIDGVRPVIVRSQYPVAMFDLMLDIREEADGITVELHYASGLFKSDTIKAWLTVYAEILRELCHVKD
jgi:non-ribosomal peptide synthetase component F/aryl carrier-like protein